MLHVPVGTNFVLHQFMIIGPRDFATSKYWLTSLLGPVEMYPEYFPPVPPVYYAYGLNYV